MNADNNSDGCQSTDSLTPPPKKSMVLNDLVKEVCARTVEEGYSVDPKLVRVIIKIMFEVLADNIKQGVTTKIQKFGSIFGKDTKSRPGRNPKTGEAAEIPAKRIPVMHAYPSLLEELNSDTQPNETES